MRPAVFLDRDGVINANRADYVKHWDEIELLDCTLPALRRLAERQIPVIVVTNQSAVGRGLLTANEAYAINRRLMQEIEAQGGRITACYLCPHHPSARCDCRKPAPGMLLQAARELELDLTRSYLVGDAVSDIEAARAAGVQEGILVLTGRGAQQSRLLSERSWSCLVVADLDAAVDHILASWFDSN